MSKGAFQNITVKDSIVIPEGCTEVSTVAFEKATVKTIELPSTISYLGERCFMNSTVNSLVFHGKTPPKLYGYWEFASAKIKHIYVPDESVEAYRLANLADWLEFEPFSEYHP